MIDIYETIHTLNKEERRQFEGFLRAKNKRTDTKNIQLFRLLSNSKVDKNLDEKLYGYPNRNAYHALSKRLQDSLIDFIAQKSFEKENTATMEVIKLLRTSRTFFEQNQSRIGFKTLKKAEEKARKNEFLSLLNEIYYTKIQFAHCDLKTDVEETIEQFKANKIKLHQEEQLNLFYAYIKQEFIKPSQDVSKVLSNALSRFQLSLQQDISFRSLCRILEIANTIGYTTRSYATLLPFVLQAYKLLKTNEKLLENQRSYYIQVLYFVANVYFRNRDFNTSLEYLMLMKIQMNLQEGKYEHTFILQYTLLYCLNLNYKGEALKAITHLDNFPFHKFDEQEVYFLDLQLSYIVYNFQQLNLKKVKKLLNNFSRSDHWYKERLGEVWLVKKNLLELLLFIELNDIDLVTSRSDSFLKKHRHYLKNQKETRVLEFVKLALTIHKDPKIITDSKFLNKVQKMTKAETKEYEDIFDISFYAWLKSKIVGQSVYETTLTLIGSNTI